MDVYVSVGQLLDCDALNVTFSELDGFSNDFNLNSSVRVSSCRILQKIYMINKGVCANSKYRTYLVNVIYQYDTQISATLARS